MDLRRGVERHTFTLVARCPKTGALGVSITTYSLAVGGYCPFIKPRVGSMSTQAFAEPRLGPLAIRLLEGGFSAPKTLRELQETDPHIGYRQLGIVDRDGIAAAYTGPSARPWAGHHLGNGFVAMGNVLAGSQVVEAMANAYESSGDEAFEERLLRAIEAGRDAGGQPQGQRSAALITYRDESYAYMDLRVDAHDEPVAELRRVYHLYEPMVYYYYYLRAKEPQNTPPQEKWLELNAQP